MRRKLSQFPENSNQKLSSFKRACSVQAFRIGTGTKGQVQAIAILREKNLKSLLMLMLMLMLMFNLNPRENKVEGCVSRRGK
uniref:Uncharacterized protein n=1 Tax=Noccaea caerulescens TaxID=107243 RepID=A0A1J3ISA0_NOCCA